MNGLMWSSCRLWSRSLMRSKRRSPHVILIERASFGERTTMQAPENMGVSLVARKLL